MSGSTALGTPASAFRYRAARNDGALVRGIVHARSEGAAASTLVSRGLFPIELAAAGRPLGLLSGVGRRDLAVAFRSMSALVAAGVPIQSAIAATEPLTREALRDALVAVRGSLREGVPLSRALAAHPSVFPKVVVGMMEGGDRASRLDQALGQLAQHLETEAEITAHLRSALAYPTLILLVGLVSIAIMTTVVIPRFAEVISDLGGDLPTSTRLLMAVATGARAHALALVLVLISAAVIFVTWSRRPHGQAKVDAVLLCLPLIGRIRHGMASGRACYAFSGMLQSGLPMLAALDAVTQTLADREVMRRFERVRARVFGGERLARSLEAECALTPSALQLVGVGDATGDLARLTQEAGNLAIEEAQRLLRTLVSLLEPALVISLGLAVASVAAALLQAVYSVRPGG